MRLMEAQVKQAILHEDKDVREAAVYYFSRSFTTDLSIMPLAIRAIEQYGWKDAFEFYSFTSELPQTDETVLWLLGQLKKYCSSTDEQELKYAHAAMQGLTHADAAILDRHQSIILNLDLLEDEAKKVISERIAFSSNSAEELWHELEAFCNRSDTLDKVPDDLDLADHLVEALGRHPEFSIPKVLAILNGKPKDNWLELCAIRLAGELRLQQAVPAIIALHNDADDWIFEDGHRALVKIGGDQVVEELARAYPAGSNDLRSTAASVLESIHTDLSVQTCLKFYENEQDHHTRCSLIQSALLNFATEAIEPARQLILKTPLDPEVIGVRNDLLTGCKVLGERFPELDEWTEDAKNDVEFRKDWYRKNVIDLDEFELENEEEIDDDLPDESAIVQKVRIGRNDPCPCGSGKKFKKCCLSKGSSVR
jgi:hypothetical protein